MRSGPEDDRTHRPYPVQEKTREGMWIEQQLDVNRKEAEYEQSKVEKEEAEGDSCDDIPARSLRRLLSRFSLGLICHPQPPARRIPAHAFRHNAGKTIHLLAED